MSDQTKLGLGIIGVALLLGMMGDGLLRVAPWGLNISLWMSALGIALAVSIRSRKEGLGGGAWLFAPVIIFSAAFAWHDSIALKLLNLLAILIALALLMLRAQGGRLAPAEIIEYAGAGIVAAFNVALGPVLLVFGCIRWREILNGQSARRSLAKTLSRLRSMYESKCRLASSRAASRKARSSRHRGGSAYCWSTTMPSIARSARRC